MVEDRAFIDGVYIQARTTSDPQKIFGCGTSDDSTDRKESCYIKLV